MENYLYKITVEIDDDKVKQLNQHDLEAVYQTVRDAFIEQNFQDVSNGKELIFIIMPNKRAFSAVGLATNSLYDCWMGKYIKRMDWYDAEDESTEDILKEFKEFDTKYGK